MFGQGSGRDFRILRFLESCYDKSLFRLGAQNADSIAGEISPAICIQRYQHGELAGS
jgi:hypothetical protein